VFSRRKAGCIQLVILSSCISIAAAGPVYVLLRPRYPFDFEIPQYAFVIMYASGKPVWYLLFTLVTLAFCLCAFVSLRLNDYASNATGRHSTSLTTILSPETIDAMNRDPRLRDTLLSLTEMIAQTSTDLGERFHFQHLKRLGANLTDGLTLLREVQQSGNAKRGLFEDIRSGFQLLGGGNGKAGGVSGLNLTGGLSGILGGIGDKLVGSLATPALFLGIGVG
jgi:hypothetical protein